MRGLGISVVENFVGGNANQPEARVRRVAWEGYYAFYSRDIRNGDMYTLKVTTNGESFECTLGAPLQHYYNNVVTLDVYNRELTPGKYPFRSVLLVSIRLLLTLLLEGIIFWLFWFRQKRSWLIFLAINLVTQGALNIWLNSLRFYRKSFQLNCRWLYYLNFASLALYPQFKLMKAYFL